MAAWIYTADGEFESLAEAIEAYKERVRKQEQEEHRAALQAAQHDPQVQSWIELANNEAALQQVANHIQSRKLTTTA